MLEANGSPDREESLHGLDCPRCPAGICRCSTRDTARRRSFGFENAGIADGGSSHMRPLAHGAFLERTIINTEVWGASSTGQIRGIEAEPRWGVIKAWFLDMSHPSHTFLRTVETAGGLSDRVLFAEPVTCQ